MRMKMEVIGTNSTMPPGVQLPVGNGAAATTTPAGRIPSARAAHSNYTSSDSHASGATLSSSDPGCSLSDVMTAAGACVKVFCTSVAPCYTLPWLRGAESHSSGSGFAVQLPSGEQRLLTTAQVVENHTLVQVRRASQAQKYVARVECVGFDVDVAVLNVDDPQFWRGMPALPLLQGLPPIMSEVLAVGFPNMGEELSTARGTVNRITLGGPIRELCVQIDAEIPPGAAGGPVLSAQGHLIGLAASTAQGQQSMGHILSLPVLHTFLQNAGIGEGDEARPYLGKSTDCFRVQALENAELRVQMGLPPRPGEGEDGGVLLTKLPADSPSIDVLKEGDVLLALDGIPIAADGTILLPEAPNVRVGMRYLVQRSPLDKPLHYLVLRNGQRLTLTVKAAARTRHLMPPRQPVPRPQWVVLGGLVFVPLLPDYEMLVPKCQLGRVHEPPSFEGEAAVMLLRVLQAEVNIGYEDVCGMLESFNNSKVKSLGHLRQLADGAHTSGVEQLEFRLVTGELLVLDAAQCWGSEQDIFAVHTIPRRASAGV